jgi:hypothetical protein
MQETYQNCPVCGKSFDLKTYYGDSITYNCNNEKEIVFAKAGKKLMPEYHSFSYTRTNTSPHRTVTWMLKFSLSPKKIVRLTRHDTSDSTDIRDQHGYFIMSVKYPLEPDFPSLEKLRNKLKTLINFS